VEGSEEVLFEGVPESDLCRCSPIEEIADVDAIATFRRGCESQQFAWLEVVEDPTIRGRCSVVELVDHHNVEAVARNAINAVGGKRLHRGEHVTPPLRSLTLVIELAKVGVSEDLAIGPEALVEDLLAVGDKEE
jgi:hypothetical protein